MVGSELAGKLKSIPSKERQEAWLRAARKPYTEEERAAARAKLVVLLDRMEDALKPSGWLVGKAYSIADIAAAPFVKRIDEEIAPDEVTDQKHPRVTEWWTSCRRAQPTPKRISALSSISEIDWILRCWIPPRTPKQSHAGGKILQSVNDGVGDHHVQQSRQAQRDVAGDVGRAWASR